MTFRENLNRICKERDTTLTSVVKSLGISTSAVTRWNEGSIPKEETMLLLSRTLNCSIMDFFADEKDLATVKPEDEDEIDILRVYRLLSRRDKHEFMTMVYEYEKRADIEKTHPIVEVSNDRTLVRLAARDREIDGVQEKEIDSSIINKPVFDD